MTKSWLERLAPGDSWRAVRDYLVRGWWKTRHPVADPAALQHFLSTRASLVAQSTLYGYLRARSGAQYPDLFANETFVRSINIAKWPIWLACLSDLSIFAGGLLARRARVPAHEVAALMNSTVEAVLAETGVPGDAGPDFPRLADQVRARVRLCDWKSVQDDDTPFSESPDALVHWAPVVEEYKALDGKFVRNSVRFRWQDVRRDLRRDLDADAVFAAIRPAASMHAASAADGA
jgi:hypothetical protein